VFQNQGEVRLVLLNRWLETACGDKQSAIDGSGPDSSDFPLDLPEAVDFFDNAVTRTLAGMSFGHRHDLTSHVRFGEVSAAHRARAAAVLKKFDVLATLE
jgi:hypothetical protein